MFRHHKALRDTGQGQQAHLPADWSVFLRCNSADSLTMVHDAQGDWVALNIMNINKQGKLFGQDYRPWFWCASMTDWQPIRCVVSSCTIEGHSAH